MPELERALRAVGASLDYPPTPDLTSGVRERLAQGRAPRRAWPRRQVLAGAAAALLVVAGALMAVPQSRSAILDWLGVGGVTIRYVEELPPAERATDDLGLGERIDLAEARERTGFDVQLPRVDGLDEPPRVYYRADARQVAFLYGTEERPKLLITQAAVGGAVEKLVGAGTGVERVAIDAATTGVWLSGDQHALFYPSTSEPEPFRLVGNALVYERSDGVTVRIEAEVSRDEALRLARSLR